MIEIENHGSMRELRLARPPVNALNSELVSALRQALRSAAEDGCEGVILSGRPGMFSAGLDLKALLAMSREEMGRFWRDFFALLEAVARFPVPIVAALTGHSPAGGAVIALFCDRRIAADGPFKIGLNEVQVGLVVPWPIQAAVIRQLGAQRAGQLLVKGALMSPSEAQATGLVEEVVEAEDTIPAALKWLQELAALPRIAMLETRRMTRRDLAEPLAQVTAADVEVMLDHWFAEETQQALRRVLQRLAAPASD